MWFRRTQNQRRNDATHADTSYEDSITVEFPEEGEGILASGP
jgi:hypothetical protein